MVLVGLTGVFGCLPLEIVLQIHKPLVFRNLENVLLWLYNSAKMHL